MKEPEGLSIKYPNLGKFLGDENRGVRGQGQEGEIPERVVDDVASVRTELNLVNATAFSSQ